MRTLYIHAGHGKTGSSYLQNTFLLSHGQLRAKSIYYPRHMSDSEAQAGSVSTGNARHSFENIIELERTLAATPNDSHSVLLSSEYVFQHFPKLVGAEREWEHERLRTLNQRLGFGRWKILLFIRDPLPFAISAWLQLVKSHRETRPLEEFVLDWPSDNPRRVRWFIKTCSELDFVDLTIFNYSRVKNELVARAAEWLGVRPDLLTPPVIERVNRSLTAGEAYLIAQLNRSGAQVRGHLGQFLVERLPEVVRDEFHLSAPTQTAFKEKVFKDIEFVAQHVASGQEYRLEALPQDGCSDSYRFTPRQLDLILEFLTLNVKKKGELKK